MILPNQLTILRIILTPIFLILFLSKNSTMIQISFIVYLIAAITDWYDGWLARKFNYITAWGKFWDPLADKILTSTVFVGFVVVGILELWMVSLVILRDLIVTLLRLLADSRGIPFKTTYYAKWKTFLQMFFLYYLLVGYVLQHTNYFVINYGDYIRMMMNKDLIYFVMLIITLITVHSGISYIAVNSQLIKKILNETNKLV
ncbi:MAG: CDP-diacylglycerol--glycerol-3-phosphate 3-phosphatidyltransferase [Ignavibacterium sp.]|nr:CDP-diacylglycerol--glycerol-3-phosphate 3-phosphatidyltransferase [Ignavibacterium sp.]